MVYLDSEKIILNPNEGKPLAALRVTHSKDSYGTQPIPVPVVKI